MDAISNWPVTARRAESISLRAGSFEVMDPRYRPDRYPLLVGFPAAEIQEGHFPISPGYCVECCVQVRERIKRLPGHVKDLILVGAVAPWNTDAKDAGPPVEIGSSTSPSSRPPCKVDSAKDLPFTRPHWDQMRKFCKVTRICPSLLGRASLDSAAMKTSLRRYPRNIADCRSFITETSHSYNLGLIANDWLGIQRL